MSELPLNKRIAEFLAAHHVVTLATGEGGAVHAASLMYALMLGRYGFLRALATGPESLRSAFNRSGFYRLQPDTITLIDNTVSFGHQETLTLSAGRGA